MLTETQKNVAVRLSVGQSIKNVAEEFHLTLQAICDFLKSAEFIDYKNQLSDSSRLRVTQYLESKQMKCAKRLEELSEQKDDLKVAHKATVDILGFTGVKNINSPAVNISNSNQNQNVAQAQAQASAEMSSEDIDRELDDIDAILKGEEMVTVNDEKKSGKDTSPKVQKA
jgi:hypothetical protein